MMYVVTDPQPPTSSLRARAAQRVRGARAYAVERAGHPLARAVLDRVVQVDLVTRAMGLGARTFVAMIPLALVVQATTPLFGGESIGVTLIGRFQIRDPSAAALRLLFPDPDLMGDGTTVTSVVILLVSVFALARAVQQLFEKAFGVDPAAPRDAWRGLVWILGLVLLMSLRGELRALADGLPLRSVVAATLTAPVAIVFWTWSARFLLRNALPWRRLIPAGALCGLTSVAVSVGISVYFPEVLASNTARLGLLGTVYALLSIILVWTYAFSTALVVGAVLGEWLAREPDAGPSPGAAQEIAPAEASTSTSAPSTTR